MPNPLDNLVFTSAGSQQPPVQIPAQMPMQINNQNFLQAAQQIYQNPAGFEQMVRQQYPEVYQQAMQIRNCADPRQVTLQMAQARGINPNILKMFGF